MPLTPRAHAPHTTVGEGPSQNSGQWEHTPYTLHAGVMPVDPIPSRQESWIIHVRCTQGAVTATFTCPLYGSTPFTVATTRVKGSGYPTWVKGCGYPLQDALTDPHLPSSTHMCRVLPGVLPGVLPYICLLWLRAANGVCPLHTTQHSTKPECSCHMAMHLSPAPPPKYTQHTALPHTTPPFWQETSPLHTHMQPSPPHTHM